MLNYAIADQNDHSSIDVPRNEEVVTQPSNRLFDGAVFVRTKCIEHHRKPVSLLSFIVTIQTLWIFGLTVWGSSSLSSNSAQKSQMIEDLQISLQLANSKIEDLERAFRRNQDDYEVRIGSEATDNLRLTGKEIWFQDSKEIEIHEVPTIFSREWSQNDLKITAGTKITWTWTSNENLVEASETYAVKSDPSFSSGAIQHGGTITHTFETPGTYYFVSENTASMRGKVVVTGVFIKDGSLSVSDISVSGSLSVTDISVSGTHSGTKIPGTIHSYQITRHLQHGTCPEGTSAMMATTGTSGYSTYSSFSNYYLVICVYQ